jgi:hypothetical protein
VYHLRKQPNTRRNHPPVDESPQTLFQAVFPVSVFSTAMLILILAYLAWIEPALRRIDCENVFGPGQYQHFGSLKSKPSAHADKQPAGTSVFEK